MLIYNMKFLKMVWFKALSIPMATGYVTIGHGSILQNILTSKIKSPKLILRYLYENFWFEYYPLYSIFVITINGTEKIHWAKLSWIPPNKVIHGKTSAVPYVSNT